MLLTLSGLWPGHGTGMRSSQEGWGLWKGEGRMQRAHGSSLRPCCSAPAQRLGVCSYQSTPFSRDTFCVPKIWSALDCPALHWPRHQQAPTNASATALTHDTGGPSRGMAPGTHTVPSLPWLRLQRITSAPLLHLQLQTCLDQAALLHYELVE